MTSERGGLAEAARRERGFAVFWALRAGADFFLAAMGRRGQMHTPAPTAMVVCVFLNSSRGELVQ